MSMTTPVRNPHASTADLLVWSEEPPSESARVIRTNHQPADGFSNVLFGGQMTDEEAESVMKRKPCSDYKWKEMTGSGIFAADGKTDGPESEIAISTHNNKTGLKIFQEAANTKSQISFAVEESVSPRKPTSVSEIAKQRELSGTIDSEIESKMKQLSCAKSKELIGHDIFGPPVISPSPLAARSAGLKERNDVDEPVRRNLRTSVKVSNPAGGHCNILFSDEAVLTSPKKINDSKFAELTGSDIFKVDVPPRSGERAMSMAKLKEMRGSDIFADGKVASRDCLGGVRKPPGGGSTIALI